MTVQLREYIDPTIGVATLPDATFIVTCMAGAVIKIYRGMPKLILDLD